MTTDSSPLGRERVAGKIAFVEYDSAWPRLFDVEAAKIRVGLGPIVLDVEHVGSTPVPGLAAKPVIDINLSVADSTDEAVYAPALTAAGYRLAVREPEWFEHRMFRREAPRVNLHVFSAGCSELSRMRQFRDWLRHNPVDLALYAATKRQLAEREWEYVQDYADAKQSVIEEIMTRARTWVEGSAPSLSRDTAPDRQR